MSRTRHRAVVAVAALAPLLAACGAGADAITNRPYAPADGVQFTTEDGRLRIINALFVAPAEGVGEGVLTFAVNDLSGEGDDLLGARAGEGVDVVIEGDTVIPPFGTLIVGGSGAEAVGYVPDFPGRPGEVIPVVLRFENAGEVLVRTVVYPPLAAYATVSAPAVPTPESEPGPEPEVVETPPVPAPGLSPAPTPEPTSDLELPATPPAPAAGVEEPNVEVTPAPTATS